MSLKHATLGLLAAGPASGYDLLQTFNKSLENVWPATQSQLYGELGKLAAAGLVTVATEGGRGRKEYTITEAGLAELRHWLSEVEPAPQRRSEMLLRVFFLGVIPPDQAEAYLNRRARTATEMYEGLSSVADAIQDDTAPLAVYGRIALEWGLRFSAMQKEWAEWAAEEVAAAQRRAKDS
jgi:DNA-binding PadR family transcriptional regulator